MKTYDYGVLSEEEVKALTLRPKIDFGKALSLVGPIVEDVKVRGNEAVRALTEKFDKVALEGEFVVDPATLEEPKLTDEVRRAFDVAYENITCFHKAQVGSTAQMMKHELTPLCSH